MDFQLRAQELLDDWNACCNAKPKGNAIGIQLEKDQCAQWASHLHTQLVWGSENDIAEAFYQFEQRFNAYKEKVVIEILTHGTV